jgi:oligopeptide transport system substrate-binding protein
MFSKKALLFLLVMVLLGVIVACGAQPTPQTIIQTVEVVKEVVKTVEVAPANPDANKVTVNTVVGTEPPSLDPSLATDTTSVWLIRQMFTGLTAFDEKANVIPALATEWKVSADGLKWTYKMRNDVKWVARDPKTGEIKEVGPVTAKDVVYGTLRTLDPSTASDYAFVLYVLQGGEEFNTAKPTDEDFAKKQEAVGVKAVDDYTVEFTLKAPAAYFPAITALWVMYPQPQADIEANKNNWTEAGLIVTNGPYTLRKWTHGAEIWIEKNPLWVNAKDVQIELFGGPIIQEESTAMAMYEKNEVDLMGDPGWGPPLPDMDRIKADPTLSKELTIAPRLCTYYYGFVVTKKPFDNVVLRKAFSAAIDRQSLIDNVLKGNQIPAHSFAPAGIFGNVADDMTIGAYMVQGTYADRVAQAKKWIAEAGYPDGKGLKVKLMHNTSEAHAQIAQAVQAMWKEAFPQADITIENQEWAVYLKTMLPGSPDADKPDVYRMGWCADYPDENNWLNEVFNPQSGQNYAKYNNPEFTKLVEGAAFEADPAKRQEMYKKAETIFADDAAIAPIYYYTYNRMYKPWLTKVVISPVGGDPLDEWKIDWEAKKAAAGK